ncbi:MAG: hypothetical protein ACI94Y_002195 [Maribacter sp.]|jgi:hypothetical protein
MKSKYLLLLFILAIYACSNISTSLLQTPEDVTIQWLEWLDNDNYAQLKKISTGSTLEYVNDMEIFFNAVIEEDDEAIEPTIVERIQCTEKENERVHCIYCCNEGDEEIFILVKEKSQWKVEGIIVPIDYLDIEGIEEDRMLEEILNNKLPQ